MGVGWDLVSFNTQGEHDYFLDMLEKRLDFHNDLKLRIGLIKRKEWMEGSQKNAEEISYKLRWHHGKQIKDDVKNCMIVMKNSAEKVVVKNLNCDNQTEGFVCSHIEYLE